MYSTLTKLKFVHTQIHAKYSSHMSAAGEFMQPDIVLGAHANKARFLLNLCSLCYQGNFVPVTRKE